MNLFIVNTSITQSIFKGFRILGCSIFKMPFRCLSFVRQLIYYTTLFFICQPLFRSFFEDFFISFSEIFVCYKLFYYTTFFFVCQVLFRTFLKFFSEQFLFTELFSRAVLFSISHFFAFVKTFCDIFFCLFSSSLFLNYSPARSLIPKFPAVFRSFRSLSR